jgi:endonuclease/exonuclease/phosphatase (EEP) superfamily protein YafD
VVVTGATVEPAVSPPAPRRRHPVARGIGAAVGWVATGLALLGLVAHFLDTRHQSLIVLASAAWVLAPLGVLGLVLHLWRRAWFAVAAALVLVVVDVVVYAPAFVAERPPTNGTTLRVSSQNMLYGEADAGVVVGRVAAADVDVFVAQELTIRSVARLRAAGLDRLLPYSVVDARTDANGTGLWSRYPIEGRRRLADVGVLGVLADLTLPGGTKVTAMTLHPSAPFPQDPSDWYHDLERIRGLLRGIPPGPVVVGGDFNATLDHARFRRLLVDGWRDGAEQAGSGWVRSWPADRAVPPVVGIDHVLTRGTVATSVDTVRTPGTDHLGLLATVVVPR